MPEANRIELEKTLARLWAVKVDVVTRAQAERHPDVTFLHDLLKDRVLVVERGRWVGRDFIEHHPAIRRVTR